MAYFMAHAAWSSVYTNTTAARSAGEHSGGGASGGTFAEVRGTYFTLLSSYHTASILFPSASRTKAA
jgi:uncharacterized protein YkwD